MLASIWSGYTVFTSQPAQAPRRPAAGPTNSQKESTDLFNCQRIADRFPPSQTQADSYDAATKLSRYASLERPSKHRAELLEALRGSAQHASRPRRAVSRAAQEPGQGNGTTSFTGVATKGTLTVVTTKGTVTVQHNKRHGATNCGDEPLGQ